MENISAIAEFNLTELLGILMMLFTFVMMSANLLMWHSMRRTIALQIKSNYSANHQSLVGGHRDLFIGLLHQPETLQRFAKANAIEVESWELKIVSAFFINQIFIHYLNFANGTIEQSYLEGLKQDAREVFAMPTVQSHWKQSRVWYSAEFQKFVEEELTLLGQDSTKTPLHPVLKV